MEEPFRVFTIAFIGGMTFVGAIVVGMALIVTVAS